MYRTHRVEDTALNNIGMKPFGYQISSKRMKSRETANSLVKCQAGNNEGWLLFNISKPLDLYYHNNKEEIPT